MKNPYKVSDEDLKKIEEKFKLLNITPDQYPEYTDPYTFAGRFKKYAKLKNVPLSISISCSRQKEQ